jgi:isopenicillin-N N-acyltransferase-like protein
MDWSAVLAEAAKYANSLESLCPRYVQEMQGVADGAGTTLLDVIALNVRTEIMFGLFTQKHVESIPMDGCTSLAWKPENGKLLLAQNWDWMKEQSSNLILCHISQTDSGIPDISMVTEAGVIGKIGLNSHGVGVCLNAIRARGVDSSKMPIHLALRSVLESRTMAQAVESVKKVGTAGSGHILVADPTGAVGLECTSKRVLELHMDDKQRILHTNHFLLNHPDDEEKPWLSDSPDRVLRIRTLLDEVAGSTNPEEGLRDAFADEEGYPRSINRCQVGGNDTQTLFNIVMNLGEKEATVTFGRPTEVYEHVQLRFPIKP